MLRRTGADPPWGGFERAHGVAFEGYYWRLVAPDGRVVVALAAVWGDWGMATLAHHPEGTAHTVTSAAARADPDGFGVTVGDAFAGSATRLRADLGPGLDVELAAAERWPRRLGALGAAHLLPGLPQYWSPVLLAADVRGGGLDGARA